MSKIKTIGTESRGVVASGYGKDGENSESLLNGHRIPFLGGEKNSLELDSGDHCPTL